jgi:hypothetical protein
MLIPIPTNFKLIKVNPNCTKIFEVATTSRATLEIEPCSIDTDRSYYI